MPDNAKTQSFEYIRRQFARLLGLDPAMCVTFDEICEVWFVSHNVRTYVMRVGSDDDQFEFIHNLDGEACVVVRFPFEAVSS